MVNAAHPASSTRVACCGRSAALCLQLPATLVTSVAHCPLSREYGYFRHHTSASAWATQPCLAPVATQAQRKALRLLSPAYAAAPGSFPTDVLSCLPACLPTHAPALLCSAASAPHVLQPCALYTRAVFANSVSWVFQ